MKKAILVLCALAGGLVLLLLSPLILVLARDAVGWVINPPFAHCRVMTRAELEAALTKGFQVNGGCCAERMFGECSIARPNSTALIHAVEAGRLDAAQALLDHGADANKPGDMGTALVMAARLGRGELVELLLRHGADASSRTSAARTAAHQGHPELTRRILATLAPAELSEACAKLLCGLAADLEQRQPPIAGVRELFPDVIRACPDPNVLCDPWRLVAYVGLHDENAPLVKALLEAGANLEARNKDGQTVRRFLQSFRDKPALKAVLEGH